MREKRSSITFIVPGRGTKPVGGFRIVYEYANRLSSLGMDVTIVHTAWLYKSNPFLNGLGRYIYCRIFYGFYKKWFPLKKEVRNNWVFMPVSGVVPDADFIVATSWETAEHVAGFSLRKGKKLYLIQGDESEFPHVLQKGWQERVRNTWKLPLHKIAISTWLQNKVQLHAGTCSRIFNGLNFDDFFIVHPPETRDADTVMMLYHPAPSKGGEDGLQALYELKKKVEGLRVTLFGMPPAPAGLENWITYHRLPTREKLRELYNRAAIFLSPSHAEGWGLPVSEAMQCGCAVVTTDIGGFKDFVKDNDTGVNFGVKDVKDMTDKLYQLIIDKERRITLARNGNSYIQNFNWDRAIGDFINVLKTVS